MNQFEDLKEEEAEEKRNVTDCESVNNNNNNRRKTVTPAPGEHPLQYNYTFWYSRRTPSRPANTQSYEQNIRQIGTVASVATGALVRSGADAGMSRRSGVQSVLQFIPKVFSGVEVRALCRTLEFFHSNLHTPCLHGARFVHRGIVMLEQVWASEFQ
ncbi:hypothetical protein PDJAM_G00078520 [Pangasius djambal]|uniref:Uncharacterized protein n=1 Tax=Pangasius djambal TaxID=1691987 RepID=A0ACC5Z4B7_9TELE|nr:hypothetical protein [Pangasius djambal]